MRLQHTILTLCFMALASPTLADELDLEQRMLDLERSSIYSRERAADLELSRERERQWSEIETTARTRPSPGDRFADEPIVVMPQPSYSHNMQPANPFAPMTDEERTRLRCLDTCWFMPPPPIEQQIQERRR